MSIPVDLDRLGETLSGYRFAYLLTTAEDMRPHGVQVAPQLHDSKLLVHNPGRRSGANAQARPAVALIWPPEQDGGYSLIVDGEATVDADVLTLVPTRAVLHRPASSTADHETGAAPGSCGSDCVELDSR